MLSIISGGDIREVQSQPGYLTKPTIDRLERAQRLSAGIPQGLVANLLPMCVLDAEAMQSCLLLLTTQLLKHKKRLLSL